MASQLTAGAIETIMNGGEVIEPVVQVLGSKIIAGQGSNDRYRLLISDGVHLNSFAMLATQLTHMLKSGELTDNSVIRITNHVVSMVKNPGKGDKRIMVILGMNVLKHGSEVGHRIGNPVPLSEQASGAGHSTTSHGTSNHIETEPPPAKRPFMMENKRTSINETNLNSPAGMGSVTHPIVSLSPYQNNWVIKVRVTSKSPMRTWSNPRGEGKLFSMDLMDTSGEIRATCFKEQADKFYDFVQPNKVYYISKARLKPANKQYSSLDNDYEMTFTSDTKVEPCEEDDAIPTLKFNFSTLSSIQDAQPGTLLDFIGICKSAGDVVTLTSKTSNRDLKKRDLTMVDASLASVTLTLWGTQAEEFNGDRNPVMAVKGGKIAEFNGGKTVSLLGSSVLQVNPDIPEAHRLRGWYDCLTPDANFNSLSAQNPASGSGGKTILLGEATQNQLGCGDKADYFSCYVTIMHCRTERALYKACPTAECQKKVIDQNNGMYRCEKCNREFDSYKYRIMLSANIGDFSGNQWVTFFQDTGEELLGHKGDEVGKWQEENSPQYNAVFRAITLHPFHLRLRAKMETFNDESRVKMTVVSVKKPDLKERCRQLIADIREMAGVPASSH